MYILFKNIHDVNGVVEFLESLGFNNSNFGPMKQNAVGICTSWITHNYTFLSPNMLSLNPHISWTTCRHECKTYDEFKQNVIKQHNQYEEYKKKLI